MKIAIVGVGGAGGYFGARLAEAGHEVALIARGEHLAAIRERGLRVDSVHGDVVVRPAHATDDPATIGPVDCVLVGVKTWQVAEAARAARPLVGPDTLVVPLQNGVEAPDQLASVLGRAHVLGGIARILSFRAGPGHIQHAGVDPSIEIGELDPSVSRERVLALREVLATARGVTVTVSADIRAALWAKLLFIASWGAVGTVARAPVGVVRSVMETRGLVEHVMREIEQVARARGVALPADTIERAFAAIDRLPPTGTTSMQRDIDDGKPSELHELVGAIGRLGAEVGIQTPTSTVMYHALLPLEHRARGQVSF